MIKCSRSDWAGGNNGEILYEASNIDGHDCAKPVSGTPSDIVAATCVRHSITYKDLSISRKRWTAYGATSNKKRGLYDSWGMV